MRRPGAIVLGFCFLAASPLAAQVTVSVDETASGTALDWTGPGGPYDVIRARRPDLSIQPTFVDLGTVKRIECGSADATTRGGFEDAERPPAGQVFCYFVRGDSYGVDSRGYEELPSAASDCPAPPFHTVAQVCAKWKADYPTQAPSPLWTGNQTPSSCDQGSLQPAARTDALRRTNLFRWLAGLPDVTENATYSSKDQAAVVIQRALGTLNHTPSSGSLCYTTAGYEGSSSSNLAAGYASLAAAVDGYMQDSGVSSLGHRRWILYPPYAQAGFGMVMGGVYPTWLGQWVFGFGADPNPAFVPYPSAGPHPLPGLLGPWSFSLKNGDFTGATVTVTRLSDGQAMTVSGVSPLVNGYGLPTLSWSVSGAQAGQYYQVTIGTVAALSSPAIEAARLDAAETRGADGEWTMLGQPASAGDLPGALRDAYDAAALAEAAVLSTYTYITHIVNCP